MNPDIKNNFHQLAKTYLESNACGLWDGALKADTHRKLCELFVSNRLNISIDKADKIKFDDERLSDYVRKSTLTLTDNLDEEIGFPLETAPNYKKLTPLFVNKFLNLATDWFDDNTCLMSDDELIVMLERITINKFGHAVHALTSYGFEFIDGEADGENRFLTTESKIGQVITVKPKTFFGCSFTLDKTIE